jgi:hypothetical protein
VKIKTMLMVRIAYNVAKLCELAEFGNVLPQLLPVVDLYFTA